MRLNNFLDRLRTQLRLLWHGCRDCGSRFTATEDGYYCNRCDDFYAALLRTASDRD